MKLAASRHRSAAVFKESPHASHSRQQRTAVTPAVFVKNSKTTLVSHVRDKAKVTESRGTLCVKVFVQVLSAASSPSGCFQGFQGHAATAESHFCEV